MRNSKVCLFVLLLHLIVFCNGKLDDKFKMSVYDEYDADKHRLKVAKLKIIYGSLEELYKLCDENAQKLYETMSELLDLYDKLNSFFKQAKRICNCVDRELAKIYDSCILKEKRMIESVNNIVGTTCNKEMKNWARITKEHYIDTLRKDNYYIRPNSDYAQLKQAIKFVRDYSNNEYNAKKSFSNSVAEIFRSATIFNQNIEATLQDYVNEVIKMKILEISKKEIKKFSNDFLIIVYNNMMSHLTYWDEELSYVKNFVKERFSKFDDYQNQCNAMKQLLQSFLESMENELFIFTKQLIYNFTNSEIFLVQNDESLVELNCDDHVPFYGSQPGEQFISTKLIDADTREGRMGGKNKNNQNYERTLIVKTVEGEQIEMREIIVYPNSEIASSDNRYIIRFSKP